MQVPVSSSYDIILISITFCKIMAVMALSIFPGWTLIDQLSTKKLALDSLSRLLLSVIFNYILIYLLEIFSYIANAPTNLAYAIYLILFVLSLGFTIRKHKKGKESSIFPWDGIFIWAALAIFIIGLQSLIFVYGVITWFGDWAEHYERAIFFTQHLSLKAKFINISTLPARGPLFNAVAALMLSTVGEEFWVYQISASILNTLLILPMSLLIRDLGRIKQYKALLWAFFILAVAPFAIQNETFTWTKFFTTGLLLSGIYLYRTSLIKRQAILVICSFIIFASAILAHYFAAIITIFFIIHLFYMVYRNVWSWQTVDLAALFSTLLLATWFLYLFMSFGFKTTLMTNSNLDAGYIKAVNEQRLAKGEKILSTPEIFLGNAISTTLPYKWRHGFTGLGKAPLINRARGNNPANTVPAEPLPPDVQNLCDRVINPNSIIGALGISGTIGLLAALYLWIKQRQNSLMKANLAENSSLNSEDTQSINNDINNNYLGHWFWLSLFIIGIPISLMFNPTYETTGLAHINLQPFICLALIFLIIQIKSKYYWQILFCTLFFIESAWSSLALIEMEMRVLSIRIQDYTNNLISPDSFFTEQVYINNYFYKQLNRFTFLSDALMHLTRPMLIICVICAIGLVILAIRYSLNNRAQISSNQTANLATT